MVRHQAQAVAREMDRRYRAERNPPRNAPKWLIQRERQRRLVGSEGAVVRTN